MRNLSSAQPILKSISVVSLTAITLLGCATAKTTTNDSASANNEIVITTATDNIVAKKGNMNEASINAWPHTDVFTDSIPGMSLAKAYKFIQNKKGTTVIVGVIDSGIDVEHEDLKNVTWLNKDEIAGNGIDDDKNGYVDDMHGWNFLGGEKGQANPEQLELTRIVKKGQARFEGKAATDIAATDKADFDLYTELKSTVDKKNASAARQVAQYSGIRNFIKITNDTIKKSLGKQTYTIQDLNTLSFTDQQLEQGRLTFMRVLDAGEKIEDVIGQYGEAIDHYTNQLNSQYKVDFKGRVAGDDPYDITDTKYGNPYVIGSKEKESHGTHVSGIIAAQRDNGIGMNGVAKNVQIMALRAVPDGDEYDKDIALAIRYAVDNGAKVVNMSFGKSYSPNAQWVYDAITYAAKKDVLLVHAAGNSGENIDSAKNFPTDSKDKTNEISSNYISVGAMSRNFDENLPATFSNYGKTNVDIFSPGVEIYSTLPKNTYGPNQGTSMAAPEVAGVAALVRSYYPKLTAKQVKSIIMDSGIEFNREVIKPGTEDEKVNFNELSVSGKVLNAYNALLMAEQLSK